MLAIAGLERAFEWLTILKSFGSLTRNPKWRICQHQ
jgi:hypothetical protein